MGPLNLEGITLNWAFVLYGANLTFCPTQKLGGDPRSPFAGLKPSHSLPLSVVMADLATACRVAKLVIAYILARFKLSW